MITTTKGRCTIEMRVDHNGYYGGSLEFHEMKDVHEECAEHIEIGHACGCIPKTAEALDDF